MILARIALGALAGYLVAIVGLLVAIVVGELGRARFGWTYDDLDGARVALVALVGAPIVGAWLVWVRR